MKSPESFVFSYDDPKSVENVLRNLEWGYTVTNNQIVSKSCPLCAAQVMYGSANPGTPANVSVEQHIMYHVDMATHLEKRR